jgi:hypothetical protein
MQTVGRVALSSIFRSAEAHLRELRGGERRKTEREEGRDR